MPPSKTQARSNKSRIMLWLHTLAQVALFCLLALMGTAIERGLDLPIPGSIIGLAILLVLLLAKWVPERLVSLGAAWLIGELLLFFIPPVVSVIRYEPLFKEYGLALLLTLVLGTVIVLVGTGLVVDRVFRFEHKLNGKRAQAKLAALKKASEEAAS